MARPGAQPSLALIIPGRNWPNLSCHGILCFDTAFLGTSVPLTDTICTARCYLRDGANPGSTYLDAYRFRQSVQRTRASRQTSACEACELVARFAYALDPDSLSTAGSGRCDTCLHMSHLYPPLSSTRLFRVIPSLIPVA